MYGKLNVDYLLFIIFWSMKMKKDLRCEIVLTTKPELLRGIMQAGALDKQGKCYQIRFKNDKEFIAKAGNITYTNEQIILKNPYFKIQ